MDKNQALKLLDLSPSFTHEELNLQWRKLAKRYHPDLAGSDSTETFILLNDAYNFLKIIARNILKNRTGVILGRNTHTHTMRKMLA